MPQLSADYVFMSYSRRDNEVMRRIVTFLREQGIKVWVDGEKLIPGTPIWEEEIERAIKGAPAVVVVLSPDSKNSEWVRREISLADQYRKRVFPVLVRGDEETSITLRLMNRQFVDIRENESLGLTALETALSAYLQELIEQEEKAKQAATQKLAEEPKVEKKENEQEYLAHRQASSEQIMVGEVLNLETGNTNTLNISYQEILWVTLGWAIGGLIGGFMYSSLYDDIAGRLIGGAIGGAIGGFATVISLRSQNVSLIQRNLYQTILAWALAGAIGWVIGEALTESIGAGIGTAIFAIIGLAGTLGMDYIRSNLKSVVVITLTWAISGALGWSIARGLIAGLIIEDKAISWAIGTAIGWSIGGFVMGRQLLSDDRERKK